MSYSVPGLRADRRVSFDAGTSLLVSGDSTAAESTLLDVLVDGPPGEATVVITTNRPADWVVSGLRERGSDPRTGLGIVDATGQDSGIEDAPVERLGSPGDLTGISLEFAKLVQRFERAGAGDRIRVGVVSVSTLLMYSDVQTVFRFLHVFTSRIQSAGLFGVFALDPGMHDAQTGNTVRAIFDAEARIEGGEATLSGNGFRGE
ncbi:MAG: hypothetical protein V5A62_19665 [Haloarculaceae archaeon]